MVKCRKISDSGFSRGLTVGCDREDLGMAPMFLSWKTGRLKLLSTDIWKEEDQKFNFWT